MKMLSFSHSASYAIFSQYGHSTYVGRGLEPPLYHLFIVTRGWKLFSSSNDLHIDKDLQTTKRFWQQSNKLASSFLSFEEILCLFNNNGPHLANSTN